MPRGLILHVSTTGQIPVELRATIMGGANSSVQLLWKRTNLNSRGRTAGDMMSNQWVVKKRHETLKVIIYSVIGLIIVTALVTLLSYAMYNNSASKQTNLPVAILARL
jgi:hypothetical protein